VRTLCSLFLGASQWLPPFEHCSQSQALVRKSKNKF
jgi:hypothetical protein